MPIDVHPKTKRVRLPRATRWQSDSETSKAAADAAEPGALSQENRILIWLEPAGRSGLRADDLYDLFNADIDQGDPIERMRRIPKSSIRRATTLLSEEGLVCAIGKRPGENPRRTPVTVWALMKFATPDEKAAQEAKLSKRRQRRG